MTHNPGHTEDGCTKCVINRLFVAIVAALLLSKLSAKHALHESAAFLANAARAAADSTAHAISLGILDTPDTSDWNGCDRANRIMSWVMAVDRGDNAYVYEGSGVTGQVLFANDKMREWGEEYQAVTLALMSGRNAEADHETA